MKEYYGHLKHARTIARSSGLDIDFSDHNKCPHTDGKTIFIKPPYSNFNDEEWTSWWHAFYHEVGHNDPDMRGAFEMLQKNRIDTGSFYGGLVNMVEDYRQERWRHGEYAGRDSALAKGRKLHTNEIIKKIRNKCKQWGELSKETQALIALIGFDAWARENFQKETIGLSEEYRNALCPEAQAMMDKLTKENHYEPLHSRVEDGPVNPEKDLEIVDKLLRLLEMDPEKKKKEGQLPPTPGTGEKSHKKGKDGEEEGEEGDGGETGDKESDEDLDGKNKEGEGDKIVVKWSEVLPHVHTDGASYRPTKLDFSTYKPGSAGKPWPDDDIVVVGLDDDETFTMSGKQLRKPSEYMKPHMSYLDNMKKAGTNDELSRKVQRLLQINSVDRYKYGKKKGRLHGKNLYRVTMKDAGSFAEKIFKKHEVNDTLDVSVSILLDCSGSMGGEKMLTGSVALVMLSQMLQAVRIPHEIAGWSDTCYSGRHLPALVYFLFRKWGMPFQNVDNLRKHIAIGAAHMGNNTDSDALRVAYNRLSAQSTKRKILIVLSDGQPCGSRPGDLVKDLKDVCKQIEADKRVELYGIGIEDASVNMFYKDRTVIKDASQLEGALINLLKKKIINLD